jgi:hypothetical protein
MAPGIASLEVSHLRIEWRQRPASSATVSRDNPTSTRAAWSCEPVMRIRKNFASGGDREQHQFGSPSHGRWLGCNVPAAGTLTVG